MAYIHEGKIYRPSTELTIELTSLAFPYAALDQSYKAIKS